MVLLKNALSLLIIVEKFEDREVVVDPQAKLDEELIVRPTSETIIWDTYRMDTIYRDLPILVVVGHV